MIELAICSALFSLFLDFCMGEGNIMDCYHRAISYLPGWAYKPLGGCLYCFSSWIFTGMFLLWSKDFACLDLKTLNFVELFQGLGINYIIIKIADKFELV